MQRGKIYIKNNSWWFHYQERLWLWLRSAV